MITIYIDHFGSDEGDGPFARSLKDKLKAIKHPFTVFSYSDLNTAGGNWENSTIEAIKSADIVIPIVSPDYLAWVSTLIENEFNKIINSKNKYLIPVLYRPSKWGSYNWLVKSKIVPEDNRPLVDYPVNEFDRVINNLVSSLENIISGTYSHKDQNQLWNQSPTPGKNLVFISHDHNDGDFAELLKLRLEKEGIGCWLDTERLKIGQDWREEIDGGIEKSLAVITIMTPEARKSEYVTYEWSFAWGKGKKIFPVMLKQTQLHPRLESLQYLDFTNRTARPFEKLIDSIKALM